MIGGSPRELDYLFQYHDRFGDASDFIFYLAGPSEPAEVLSLVTQYIASLPSTNRTAREVPRDFHIPVRKDRADAAGRSPGLLPEQVVMNLTLMGKVPADSTKLLEGMQALSSTSWILGRRLRNLLREEMGVTYNAAAPYVQYWTPDPRYVVPIQVIVDSLELDTTAKVVMNTVEQLRTNGPTDEELRMASAIRKCQLENARKRNSWWIEHLQVLDRSCSRIIEKQKPVVRPRQRLAFVHTCGKNRSHLEGFEYSKHPRSNITHRFFPYTFVSLQCGS